MEESPKVVADEVIKKGSLIECRFILDLCIHSEFQENSSVEVLKKKKIQYAGSWQIVNKKVIRCFWLLGVRADVYVMLSAEVFCRFVWCMFSDRQVGGGQYVRGYDKDYPGQGPCPSSHRLIAFCPSMDRPSPLLYQYRTDVMDQKTL